jgi:diguanylate cyclase (GGDEF)-like protein
MLERDILYREWVNKHGGVYVLVSEDSPPNPYMEFLPDRDIKTTDGRQLTLINPAYMSRQAFELTNSLAGSISKITSIEYLNPENAPDDWERNVLLKFGPSEDTFSEVVDIEGQLYLRALKPFYIQSECLKCHEDQGYKLGEVRGGLSIAIPFETFASGNWQHSLATIVLFGLLWLVGLIVVVLLGRKLYTQTSNVIESERLRDHAEMSLNFLSYYDRRTNPPNRFKFEKHLHEIFPLVKEDGDLVAVTTLEIRNYKQIVDNFDHPVSDNLFKLMAERVVVLLSSDDSVARFGEDRLLFSYTCRDGEVFNEGLMQQLLSAVSKPLTLEGHEFFPVVCMGFALYPNDARDAKSLVHKAVSALTFCLEKNRAVSNFTRSRCKMRPKAVLRSKVACGVLLPKTLLNFSFNLRSMPRLALSSVRRLCCGGRRRMVAMCRLTSLSLLLRKTV